MNHIDDDMLMKLALELLDGEEAAGLEAHISECEDCRVRLEGIRRDMDLLGSIEPGLDRAVIPLPGASRPRFATWLRVAALVLFGFAVGYGVSRLEEDRIIYVVPHRVDVAPPSHTYPSFSYCESPDLSTESLTEAPGDSAVRQDE